jgi:hypothetical protein
MTRVLLLSILFFAMLHGAHMCSFDCVEIFQMPLYCDDLVVEVHNCPGCVGTCGTYCNANPNDLLQDADAGLWANGNPACTLTENKTVVWTYPSENCPGGYFCSEGTYKPELCDGGYYCPEKSAEQTPCTTLGTYCPVGSEEPSACREGWYCPTTAEDYTC